MKVVPPGDVRFCLSYINNEMKLKSNCMAVKRGDSTIEYVLERERGKAKEREEETKERATLRVARGEKMGLNHTTTQLHPSFRQLAWDFENGKRYDGPTGRTQKTSFASTSTQIERREWKRG